MSRSKSSTPIPNPDTLTPQGRQSTNSSRSIEAALKKLEKSTAHRLNLLIPTLPTITIDKTLKELNLPTSRKSVASLTEICNNMEERNSPARCTSVKVVDGNGEPILFYLGRHLQYPESSRKPTKPITMKDFYVGQTLADIEKKHQEEIAAGNIVSIHQDGLLPATCSLYRAAVQSLVTQVKIHPVDPTRHTNESKMRYAKVDDEESGSDMDISVDEQQEEPEHVDINMDAYQHSEDAGLLHLVHAWIQQNQRSKGLFISGDITRTSGSTAAVQSHYFLTQKIAIIVGQALKATFPEFYAQYMKAFEAGVFFRNDPGPFLARALIYKLQGGLHKDRHDMGPSISFGVGDYTGGEMIVPQLGMKFQYLPGDMLIFFSGNIYHKVARFIPKEQSQSAQRQDIMPGRIGTVFFFPEASFDLLKDKPAGWGHQTAFGINDHLVKKMYGEKEENE